MPWRVVSLTREREGTLDDPRSPGGDRPSEGPWRFTAWLKGGSLACGAQFDGPWHGTLEVRLCSSGGMTEAETPVRGRRCTLRVPAPAPGEATLAVSARDASGECRLRHLTMLELAPDTPEEVVHRATWVASWLRTTYLEGVRPGPMTPVMPLALDGCTRRALVLSEADTLRLELPRGSRGTVVAWFAALSAHREGHAEVTCEAQVRGRWRPCWTVAVDEPLRWIPAEWGLPVGAHSIRFRVRGAPAVAVAEPIVVPGGSPRGKANLIVIVLDTVRADRLGCYGYTVRPTSPALDSLLASKGFTVFRRASSPGASTVPSTVRFLSSRYREDPP